MCQVDTNDTCNKMLFFTYLYDHHPSIWDELPSTYGVAADSCVKYIMIAQRDKSPANTYGRMDGCMESRYL